MNRSLIIISDLHIGAGPLDDCDAELEGHLVDFVSHLASRNDAIELIINGDFLDFAQAPPWQGSELESTGEDGTPLCFTEEQSHAKFLAIEKAHKPIFKVLRSFLSAKPDNLLTVLPGNHDADLFWDSVRSSFIESIAWHQSFRDRIRIHLEQVYRPHGYPEVWIEHGHQYDPCNNFKHSETPCWSEKCPPVFSDLRGITRLYECVGTRFLIKFLNQLDAEYPFVDNVKPFSRFIRIFGVSSFAPGYGPLKATVMVWDLLQYLAQTVTHQPSDLLGLDQPGEGPEKVLTSIIQGMSDSEKKRFTDQLIEHGFPLDRPIGMLITDRPRAEQLMKFLVNHLELIQKFREKDPSLLGLSGSYGTLTLAKGFSVDETKELKQAAARIYNTGMARAVLMGHTHETADQSAGHRYINTGSWTRYYRFASEEERTSWSILRSNSFELFPYQLNYVETSREQTDFIRKVTFRERAI